MNLTISQIKNRYRAGEHSSGSLKAFALAHGWVKRNGRWGRVS